MEEGTRMTDPVFIKKVMLKNYKSIAHCSVSLGALTFLVGPNGAGKSNFIDALRLVTESLTTSLDHALRDRGGINEVRRRSSGHPTHFGISLEFMLPDSRYGHYGFRVGAQAQGGFEIQQEECRLFSDSLNDEVWYKVESGRVIGSSATVHPPAVHDRLYLVAAAGLPEFLPIYDLLSHMGFYNLNPDAIRDLQAPDAGEVLARDGHNLASVLRLMAKENDQEKEQVVELLGKVVPGITDVSVKHVGKKESLEFRQIVGPNAAPWRFMAENMSDGTLRALGVLIALFQSSRGGKNKVPLVGIEEPEVALHPGAAGVLRDALRAASRQTQVIVTSHSPDLLDDDTLSDESILPVINIHGETKIGPIDPATRSALRDRLYTAGELLRLNQLTPDLEVIQAEAAHQDDLFERKSS